MNPEFLNDSVMGIPLVAVVLGLVTWLSNTIGITGRLKLLVSMLVGLALGFFYHYTQKPPTTPEEWFSYVIYGLALGLFASGLYDVGKEVVAKVVANVGAKGRAK